VPSSQTDNRGCIPARQEPDLLLSAFTKALAEEGYAAVTLRSVARTAGVPEREIEARFETREQGLIAAQDAFLERLWLEVRGACEVPSEWPRKVSAGLACAIGALTEASALARAFTVEATGASLVAAERHFAAIDRFASLLTDGRRRYPRAGALPELTEQILIGGIASIAASVLLAEEPAALLRQRAELTEMLLIPYLGAEEARSVAQD
jgi:AcrR family transcriptional regulator